jgi:hypothetical protein
LSISVAVQFATTKDTEYTKEKKEVRGQALVFVSLVSFVVLVFVVGLE